MTCVNEITVQQSTIEFILYNLCVFPIFPLLSVCCRLLLSRSGLPRWFMTRMMLTLRTKWTRWGIRWKYLCQWTTGSLSGFMARWRRADTFVPDGKYAVLTLEKYVCVAAVSDTNLYCHALQNWCILSLMHLLMVLDISDVCVCCFPSWWRWLGRTRMSAWLHSMTAMRMLAGPSTSSWRVLQTW